MNPSIAELRRDTAERVETLRARRAAAVLSSEAFDHAALAAAQSELDAFGDAEAEAVSVEREAQIAAAENRRRALCGDLLAAEDLRLEAVDKAEEAARDMIAAIGAALSAAKEVGEIAGAVDAPPPFTVTQTEMHIAERLAALIATLKPKNFGAFINLRPPMAPADRKWLAAERIKAAAEIESIVEKMKG